ncbi:MAG: DUF6783 domain-containing protein [Blautia wexlerae]|uniref:DUF6783 domain-containing protein n=1 Tax=Blautia wexlerae TaxID=418240 RepID=UPI003A240A8A
MLSARCMSKYTEKWGVQIAGMIFQTLWSTHHKKSSGRGHRNFFLRNYFAIWQIS